MWWDFLGKWPSAFGVAERDFRAPMCVEIGISTLRESNAVGVFVHPSDGRAFVGGVLGCYRGEMLRGEPEV